MPNPAPTDEELQIAEVSSFITGRANLTKFQVVPPPTVSRIGSITTGTDQLTVNSSSGVTANLYVYAQGIPTGTIVSSIAGNILTLSENATETFQYRDVVFYVAKEDGLLPLKPGQTLRFFSE